MGDNRGILAKQFKSRVKLNQSPFLVSGPHRPWVNGAPLYLIYEFKLMTVNFDGVCHFGSFKCDNFYDTGDITKSYII